MNKNDLLLSATVILLILIAFIGIITTLAITKIADVFSAPAATTNITIDYLNIATPEGVKIVVDDLSVSGQSKLIDLIILMGAK